VFEQFLDARVANEELALPLDLPLEGVDASLLISALGDFRKEAVGGDHGHHEHYEHEKHPIEGMPDSPRRWGCLEVTVGRAHLAHLTSIYGVVTKFLFNSQQLVVFGHPNGDLSF